MLGSNLQCSPKLYPKATKKANFHLSEDKTNVIIQNPKTKQVVALRLLNITTKRSMGTAYNTELESFANNCKKIVGAALNYMDIVKERNVPVPTSPLLFLKPSSSIIQEGQDIVIPKLFQKVAFEVELGVIIGKCCKNVSKANAMDYVGGYCLTLDMTAHCFLGVARSKGEPWTLGKGFDTSTPVSNFIKLQDIKDPHNVDLWLKVNGETKQKGNTSDLIFKVNDLIAYTSQYMTLEPNDIILTGTPKGSQPIKNCDVIECGMGNMVKMTFTCKNE